ncbi:MAG: outer membrane protein assembly factor BamA [Anaeromyxobacteraceae bacterium]
MSSVTLIRGALLALCVALAPAAALAQLAPDARPAEGAKLADVRVEGNRRVEVDVVRGAVSQKKGATYDPKAVAKDVKALMKLGYFADVVARLEGPKTAPVLVYVVTERPTIAEVKHEGNDELTNDDLKDTIELKPFDLLDLARVQKDVKKIQEKYVEKGYYLAEVGYRIVPKPENQVDVVYTIDEKAKVLVKDVRFVGNDHISDEDILQYMQTRPGNYFSGLTSMGTFKEDAFEHDLQAVSAVYLDRGYVLVKVGKPTVSLSADRKWIYITIPIEEGEPYTIGNVKFSGQLLDMGAVLPRVVRSKAGDGFVRSRVGQDLFAVTDVYKDLGYAYANVTPITNTDAAKRTIDIDYNVQPGVRVKFERIDVIGNEKTRDKVIRREMRVYEGELYSGTGIKVSKQRVTALGYFETVEITTKPGSADDKIVAVVEVKERATGTFQVGAGFSSYENFVLTGQISQQNFFGWGQTLSLQVQWSSVRQLGQIQFIEPYFLDTKWTFAFDIYATEGVYTNFTRRTVGGSLTWGYELNGLEPWWSFARHLEDVRLIGTYTNERVNVTGTTSTTLANQLSGGTTSSFRLSLQVDKRDNRIFATRGWFASASAEVAPPLLAPEKVFGSVILFTRYALELRGYRPVFFDGLIARGRLTLGAIRAWDATHQPPISELYYVGGINSIRGYRYFSISPSRRIGGTKGDPQSALGIFTAGGDWNAVLNTELEFPLIEKVGVRGVVFFDAGNAWAYKASKYERQPYEKDLYRSVGFGFRWVSPVGPLRFEWGIPLDRRKDPSTNVYLDNALDFQFTIGNFF